MSNGTGNGTSNQSVVEDLIERLDPTPSDISFCISALLFLVLCPQVVYSVWLQNKNMAHTQMKMPAIYFFLGLLLFQVLNMAMIYTSFSIDILLFGVVKVAYGVLVYIFYTFLRLIVFFETLFKNNQAHQLSIFTSEDGDDLNNLQNSRRRSSVGMVDDKRERIREKLLNIPYDKAFEEEKILNIVYPSQEIQRLQPSLDQQKLDAFEFEVFEIGKVARCCQFCAFEYFESVQEARSYLSGVRVSIYLYIFLTVAHAITFFVLYETDTEELKGINLNVLLICLELCFAFYMVYSMYSLSVCLNDGIIYEYEPVVKFLWFVLLGLAVLIQTLLCSLLTFLLAESSAYQNPQIYNSVLISLEMLGLLSVFKNHFLVRQNLGAQSVRSHSEIDKSYSEGRMVVFSPNEQQLKEQGDQKRFQEN